MQVDLAHIGKSIFRFKETPCVGLNAVDNFSNISSCLHDRIVVARNHLRSYFLGGISNGLPDTLFCSQGTHVAL